MQAEPTMTRDDMHSNHIKTSLLSRLRPFSPIYLIDIALLFAVGIMFISDEVVVFFHLVFALLAIGAFFWSFPAFLRRTLFWISIASLTVLAAVYYGNTQSEELFELPLMTIVVISVYVIAQRRAAAQQQVLRANIQLEERAKALAEANQALREESDTRARLQEDVIRSKERYTHLLVHDLKNPLTGSLGFIDMLNMTSITPEQTDMVRGARTAVRRTIELVDSLLDIARLQENRLQLRRSATNVATLLTTTMQELQPWAAQESKQLDLVLGSSLPLVRIDAVLMQRVMSNLCSNAIKHTPPRTRISLGATLEAEHVRLWVHDTGPGIPAEYHDTLFHPFSTKAATNGKQTSTGLGLTFCKLAVEAHEGELTFHSTSEDGTLFSVLIPRAVEYIVSEPVARERTTEYAVSDSGAQPDVSLVKV